jgi:hypothetical protein
VHGDPAVAGPAVEARRVGCGFGLSRALSSAEIRVMKTPDARARGEGRTYIRLTGGVNVRVRTPELLEPALDRDVRGGADQGRALS